MKGLPDEFGGLCSLRFLTLEYNNLSSLPKTMGELSSLKTLRLFKNKNLEALPAELVLVKKMKLLELDSAVLGGLSEAHLKWLDTIKNKRIQ